MNLNIFVLFISRMLFLFVFENLNFYFEIFFDQVIIIGEKYVVVIWLEKGKVYIWDLICLLNVVNDLNIMFIYVRNEESFFLMFIFKGYQVEGFVIDWFFII